MHQSWPSTDGRYIFANNEGPEFGVSVVIVYDCKPFLDAAANPSSPPVFVRNWTNGSLAYNHNLYVHNIERPMGSGVFKDYIFESNYNSGLRVFQVDRDDNLPVSDPNKIILSEIGFYDTYLPNDGPGYEGEWSNFMFCLLYTSPSPRDRS